MNIGERVREVRKALKLSQTEFGVPLGLSQAAIGGYENGSRQPSNGAIVSICRQYGVSEEWLRNGIGDMFKELPTSTVAGLAMQYNLDQFDQAMIEEYLKLDPASKKVIKEYVRKVYLASDEEAAIKKEVAAYEADLREQKREASSISEPTKEKRA